VALVRTDVSEGFAASIIRMERISTLGTALAVTSNRSMLQKDTDDGGNTFLQNVDSCKIHMALHPRRLHSTGLESYFYNSLFAFELCLSLTMLCSSAGFVTRMKIEQRINLKFLANMTNTSECK
jgi:hypothetical protein